MKDDFELFIERERNTHRLLEECRKVGITRVAIRVRHKSVPSSVWFPDDFVRESVFQYPSVEYPKPWPAIWHATRAAEMYGGCGNHLQASLKYDVELDVGVHSLRNGVWRKIYSPPE